MAYIYKITNDINGKSYIGKTEFSIEKRFKEHCRDAFRERNEKRPLYFAMRKYGIDHFHIEQIEETSNPNEREAYWIDFYQTYSLGYNATKGGDGNLRIDYQKVVEEFKKTGFCTQTAKNLGICTATVVQILDTLKIPHKKFLECRGVNKKPVKQFTKKRRIYSIF